MKLQQITTMLQLLRARKPKQIQGKLHVSKGSISLKSRCSSGVEQLIRNVIILPIFYLCFKGLWIQVAGLGSLNLLFRDLVGRFLGLFDFEGVEFRSWVCSKSWVNRVGRGMVGFDQVVMAWGSGRACLDWLPECSPNLWRRAWLGALVLVMRDCRKVRWLLGSREPGRFKGVLWDVADSVSRREPGGLLHRGLMWWLGQCGKANGKPENVMLGLICSTQDELDSGLSDLLQCGAGGYWLHLKDLKEPVNLRLVGNTEGLEVDALAEGRVSLVLFSGDCDPNALLDAMNQCYQAGVAYDYIDMQGIVF